MNILFLTLVGFTDINEQGIYTDLLRQFRDNKHNVYVVSPREKREGKLTEYKQQDGIHDLKVQIGNITKTNKLEKGISTLRIENQYIRALKGHFPGVKFDLVIYSTPPITFAKAVDYIKQRDKARSYLLLKDIFPQNAVDLQMIRENSLIHKYFRNKEKKLYALSDYIGCMSQANVEYVLKNNPEIDKRKVEVCPNSIEPFAAVKDAKIIKEIRNKYGLPTDKTIFIYGGNLGKPQGIDFVINCLRAIRASKANRANRTSSSNNQAYFLVIGSGTDRHKLEKYLADEKPENIKLMDQVPREEYEQITNACDVGLIFLDNRFTIPNYPSRLLSYMQASMPVLAATDVNTDIRQTIEQGEFGYWSESNNVQEFTDNIQKLLDSEIRKKMGKKAREYLENNFTAKHSYHIIMKHFESENTDV